MSMQLLLRILGVQCGMFQVWLRIWASPAQFQIHSSQTTMSNLPPACQDLQLSLNSHMSKQSLLWHLRVFPALHGWFPSHLNPYTLPAMATAQESRSAPAVWKNGALPFETIANHCALMESREEPGCTVDTVAGWSGDYRHVVDLSGIQIQAFTSLLQSVCYKCVSWWFEVLLL